MSEKQIQAYVQEYRGDEVGFLTGPNHHTQALAGKMERRGEIRRVGQVELLRGGAVARVTYVRLKPAPDPGLRLIKRIGFWVSVGGVYVITMLALAWNARFIIMQTGGALLLLAALWWIGSRMQHSGACPGLHCTGCRG